MKKKRLKKITLGMVLERRACYSKSRLERLYAVPRTPMEVLTLKSGPWRRVPARDRIWTLTHDGALPEPILRLFAARCARSAQPRVPGEYAIAAIETAERCAYKEAGYRELGAAYEALVSSSERIGDSESYHAARRSAICSAGVSAYSTCLTAARTSRSRFWGRAAKDLIRLVACWQRTGGLPKRKS